MRYIGSLRHHLAINPCVIPSIFGGPKSRRWPFQKLRLRAQLMQVNVARRPKRMRAELINRRK